MKQILHITLLSFLIVSVVSAQQKIPEKIIQVNGFVLDFQLKPIPNVNIYSVKLRMGTASNHNGIYSIVSTPGDTIVFRAVGFRRTHLMIPDSVNANRYLTDVYLENDTIRINDVLVLPWGTYAEFKRAVVEADIHDQKLENMNDNLILIQKQLLNSTGISPEAAYNQITRQIADAAYIRGQGPSNNLLNPFAWAKFFQGLRSGLLKNEKK